MRPSKTVLAYLLVAAVLGTYIWFFERHPKEEAAPAREKIFEFVADDVRSISLTNSEAAAKEDRSIVLKKDAQGEWSIAEPGPYEADPNTVRTILTTLADPGVEERIPSPGDLKEFGLDKPAASVACGLADGKSISLFIGGRSINEKSIYVKPHNQPDVFMVEAAQVSGMNLKVRELRNKVVYATGYVEARKLLMKRPGREPVLLEKKEETWQVRTPAGQWITADEDATRQILNVVNGIRAQEYFDRPDLAKMGLGEKNRGTLEIWPSEKKPSVVLVLGNKLKDQKVYLRRKDKPFAVSVVDHFDRDTDKTWSDFRDRNVMRFEPIEAVQLTISKPGASLTYVRNADDVWTSPGRDQANDEASRILDALSSTRIQAFAEKYTPQTAGVMKPPHTAVVTLKNGKTRTFKFGKRDNEQILLASDRGSDIYAVLPNAANHIENALTGIAPAAPTSQPLGF